MSGKITWFEYVPLHKVPVRLWSGKWKIANDMADSHHGFYSLVMEWTGDGDPPVNTMGKSK